MRRTTLPAALVFAGAIALSGCAAGGGGDTAEPTEDACASIASEVRDISNGVQNNLAAPASVDELESYLEEAQSRVDGLIEEAGDDEELAAAVDAFKASIGDASEYAAGLTEGPSEEDPEATVVEQDPDALAEQQTAVQEAGAEVGSVCSAEEE